MFGHSALGQVDQHICADTTGTYSGGGGNTSIMNWYLDGVDATPDFFEDLSTKTESALYPGYYLSTYSIDWEIGNIGDHVISMIEDNGNCESATVSRNIRVHPVPTITDPVIQSSIPACSGQKADITVNANGSTLDGLTLQYRLSGEGIDSPIFQDGNVFPNIALAGYTYTVDVRYVVTGSDPLVVVKGSFVSKVVLVRDEDDVEDPVISNCLTSSTIWSEDFDAYPNFTFRATKGATTWEGYYSHGVYNKAAVVNDLLEMRVEESIMAEWTTNYIDISSEESVQVSFELSSWNASSTDGYVEFWARVDADLGGNYQVFKTVTGPTTNQLVKSPYFKGDKLELMVRVTKGSSVGIYYIDNIVVNGLLGKSVDVGECTYTVQGTEFNVTATDNCTLSSLNYNLTGVTTGTGANLDGVVFNQGLTTITWTATDASSNTSTCSFDITVSKENNLALLDVTGTTTPETDPGVTSEEYCPDLNDLQAVIAPSGYAYSSGTSQVQFRVDRLCDAGDWSFTYNVGGAEVVVDEVLISGVGTTTNSSGVLNVNAGTSYVLFTIDINNVVGTLLPVDFTISTGGTNSAIQNAITIQHKLKIIPQIVGFE